MKFKINRDHFSNGLAQVLNVVGSKATMPILSNVLIEAEKDHISLTTTNLDLGIRCKIKAEVKEGGSVTLPVKRLATIVRELPNVDVSFDANATHQVKTDLRRFQLPHHGHRRRNSPSSPTAGDDKPTPSNRASSPRCSSSVSYAQSTDETRYILNGVYFNFKDGKLSLVATDGRRLAWSARKWKSPPPAPARSSCPPRPWPSSLRLLDKGEKLKIAFNERRAAFQIDTDKDASGLIDNIYLFSKVVEGNYPNYQQVIPKETHQRIKLERELFLQCVHRAALVTSEKSNSVKIKLTATSSKSPRRAPISARRTSRWRFPTAVPTCRWRSTRSLSWIRSGPHQGRGVFRVKDEVSPGVFKTLESFVCVIMPVRLS
jgi:DNA polymerase-3 subunit beta